MSQGPYHIRRRIEQRLDSYLAIEVVLRCAQHMTGKEATDLQHVRRYPPWLLLLLVKWVLMRGNVRVSLLRPLADRQFEGLVDLMHRLSGCVRLPEAYDNPYLLVRNLAFQQFYLHHRSPYSFAMGRLGRNQLLFGSLPSAHPFQADFARITGLTISQFLELSMTLVCRFLVEGERSLTVDWLEPAQRNYPPGTTQRFLDALSRDRSSVTEWLRSAAGSHSLACELYEESPLQ